MYKFRFHYNIDIYMEEINNKLNNLLKKLICFTLSLLNVIKMTDICNKNK